MTQKQLRTKIIIGILILLVVLVGIILVKNSTNTTSSETVATTEGKIDTIIDVIINGNVITAELAMTEEEKAIGLMNRQNLDANSGMLFVYQNEADRGFWMKDTFIPLDIVFIDEDRKVVSISANTKPNQTDEIYYSDKKSMYVLELNAGKAEELDIKPGNAIIF